MERLKKFKEKESFTFVNELVKAFPPPPPYDVLLCEPTCSRGRTDRKD